MKTRSSRNEAHRDDVHPADGAGGGGTEEAVAYNSLVAAWNSLLLEDAKAGGPSQQAFDA